MSKKPPVIVGLAQTKENPPASKATTAAPSSYKFVQVRLTADDAKRFRRAAEDNAGLTLQAAMVEAINALMLSWGESPVSDPGTQLRKKALGPSHNI
jgi:hypothetical protein